MDSAYYAACTALMSKAQALDTIADNLANTSTSGYRGEHNVFRSVLTQRASASASPLSQAINNFGILGGIRLDAAQGTLERTGNEQDVAIEGPGYFAVQAAGGTVYTRNGSFRIAANHTLVTSAGDPVLGQDGPINVLDGPVSISSDGTISIRGALAGKLKLVEFHTGTTLQKLGKTYYAAPAGSAGEAQHSRVRQGMLEDSNVNPVAGAVELVEVQREAEMMQRVLTMLNAELNKVAAQELPRVNA